MLRVTVARSLLNDNVYFPFGFEGDVFSHNEAISMSVCSVCNA